MNKNKVGLIVGSLMGLFHAVWGLLVLLGLAQSLLDFVFNLHSLNSPFLVMPFDFVRTLGLIVLTFIVGYVFGFIFALIWNKFHQ
ncbi:MAG: hypothetical protein WCW93_00460 [Candidatus Paceibacterota bacterium]